MGAIVTGRCAWAPLPSAAGWRWDNSGRDVYCQPSVVIATTTEERAVAQLGSALDWGSRGRRFKSCQPDRLTRANALVIGFRARYCPDRVGIWPDESSPALTESVVGDSGYGFNSHDGRHLSTDMNSPNRRRERRRPTRNGGSAWRNPPRTPGIAARLGRRSGQKQQVGPTWKVSAAHGQG